MKAAITADRNFVRRAMGATTVLLCTIVSAGAQEDVSFSAFSEDGFARLVLTFEERQSLPDYDLRMENNILSIEFDNPVDVVVPDVGEEIGDYASLARADPDSTGIRVALLRPYRLNSIEAGERLFIDLLPQEWSGMPPSLPQAVIDELAERAEMAAIAAERERKAREAEALRPQVAVRLGRNPTFLRLQFDWSVPTEAVFNEDESFAEIGFEWPVPIELGDIQRDLPPEIAALTSVPSEDGTRISMELAEGVSPRFFRASPTQYLLDIDLDGPELPELTQQDLVQRVAQLNGAAPALAEGPVANLESDLNEEPITPLIKVVGNTVRVVFPFEQDVPAAVFRRGNTVWMLFDTGASILEPESPEVLESVASGFESTASTDVQIVRMDLAEDRLATLGSEGRAWVLSLGDILLAPTAPVELHRSLNADGFFVVNADLERPGRVHRFEDPDVGDELQVVTAYAPSRGVVRPLEYVDFSALKSVHGLVVKPKNPQVDVDINERDAVLSAPGGLTVSESDTARAQFFEGDGIDRSHFLDLEGLHAADPVRFDERLSELMTAAAGAEGVQHDAARLKLAQFYVANRYAQEALGVLRVLENNVTGESVTPELLMTRAIADTLAYRADDALNILSSPQFLGDIDALVWRTIARTEAEEYRGARQDALIAVEVIDTYPVWVQTMFALAGMRSAVEVEDVDLAEQFASALEDGRLTDDQASLYHLLVGRIAELRDRPEEALDTYGRVIAADVRPTRPEAIYRTLRILDERGELDVPKALETLSSESMMWRGGPLEADMVRMLADLYFRAGEYRPGFETVQQAVAHHPDNPAVEELRQRAQTVFGELFLDGRADTLEPVEALALYYDFRQLTPPGPRGDEMIRNLAWRLVDIDLLTQAAELLDYQLNNRLQGAAKSQLAADLAVLYLADRKPQEALEVLNATRLPNLSATLVRKRRILEARALIDGERHDLALDVLSDLSGRDVEQLRIDAHWRAGRRSKAAEEIEALYAGADLDEAARMQVVRAAVGYVLGNDEFGLSRLREKYGERMATSPQWPMFDFVTSPLETTSLKFRQLAREVAALDSVNAFINSYRSTYGEARVPAAVPQQAVADGVDAEEPAAT
ncbi:hypothetical protein GCM10007989_06630 [Devosia pacifica]|uniref:Tetratricopeptide repeat protein n=1 Tax=Devosia pacifica TaxID=1335967 RepID=A0A918RWY7_9HYPH|nr:hypothetical protein [Devosia pacifica]GHA14604.1 hypothetical protein GCM10007989_06630 [Devosia pacifica]